MTCIRTTNEPRSMEANIRTGNRDGFSIIEMLVVLTLVAMLAGLALPVVTNAIHRAKEAALKENLQVTRKAIDDYYTDFGRYPPDLEQLVEQRYLRATPLDPITESRKTWVLVRDENAEAGEITGIVDLRSGATGVSCTGAKYSRC